VETLATNRKTLCAGLETIHTTVSRRASDASTNIASYTEDAATKAEQGRLTTTAAAGCQISVVRVDRATVDVVVGLEMHDGLRLCGTGVEDRSFCPEGIVDHDGAMLLVDPGDVGSVGCNVITIAAVVLLSRDRETEQSTLGLR
jgi:hypothetical protein